MSKISIIIPVYNSERYLSSALDSVLSQQFTDIEVICINDGSTDGSAQILKRYQEKDQRVKVFNQNNGGGSAARNNGISHSTGEYIMFLDSDDIYAENIVKHAYDRAISTGADIVFYNFARFIGKPTKMAVVNKTIPKDELEFFTKATYGARLFNDFAIITWNKLIKKSVITDNNLVFNTELSHNHDVDFSIRLILAAKSYSWLDEVGYYYRSNDSGLTATRVDNPTNVLKILINLNKSVSSQYKELKPSFNNYVADMVAGTIIKYSYDTNKLKEVFEFSHDVVIPELGMGSRFSGNEAESTGIFSIVDAGDYEKLVKYINSPKRKIRGYIRKLYYLAQGVLARLNV